MSLTKERIEALCTDGMYAGVNGDQSEWAELRDLALKGIAPEETRAFDARWRDVAVVLPPEGEDVLGYYDHGEYAIIRRKWGGGYVLRNGTSDIAMPGKVSLMYWMPLPFAPQNGSPK